MVPCHLAECHLTDSQLADSILSSINLNFAIASLQAQGDSGAISLNCYSSVVRVLA